MLSFGSGWAGPPSVRKPQARGTEKLVKGGSEHGTVSATFSRQGQDSQ